MKSIMRFLFIVSLFILFTQCTQEGPTSTIPEVQESFELGEVAYSTALEKASKEFDLKHSHRRPIEDFLAAQGTFCFDPELIGLPPGECLIFVPPVANFIGWTDPEQNHGASVDYAGLADAWIRSEGGEGFHTQFKGKVYERALDDGRAKVKVVLETRNALTWITGDINDFTAPLIFGHRAPEVFSEEKTPALGRSLLELVFINTAPGAPLPDFMELLAVDFGILADDPREILEIEFRAKAKGELHELFGVPDGTPGEMRVRQQAVQGPPAQYFEEKVDVRAHHEHHDQH